MAKAKAVYLYLDYLELFESFSLEERGRLITAMLQYAAHGVSPEFNGPERYIWPTLRGHIDRDREKYEKTCRQNAENARSKG